MLCVPRRETTILTSVKFEMFHGKTTEMQSYYAKNNSSLQKSDYFK